MKVALSFIALTAIIIGFLVFYFTPKNHTQEIDGQEIIYTKNIFDILKNRRYVDNIDDESSNFATSTIVRDTDIYNEDLTAQSGAVEATNTKTIIAVSTEDPDVIEEDEKTNTESILDEINEQFLAEIGQSTTTISDDELNSIFYYSSSVDFEPTQYLTVSGNEELHEYGNELAKKLTTFRIAQGDQLALFNNFFKDSTEPTVQEKVIKLGSAYNALAIEIETLNAPESAGGADIAIVNALKSISQKIKTLATAQGDTEIYNESLSYNESSAELAKAMLVLIDSFTSNGVRYKSYEPGSIFMFK